MCKSPNLLPNGSLVGCRRCSLCKDRYTMDWAGRCIAESKTAKHSYFVLLTYGRDEYGDSGHIRAAVLTYSDVQKYFKKLRKKIGKFKYFIVGEYGGANGRTHWHAIIFTQKEIKTEIPWGQLHDDEMWGHGWVSIKPFHWKHARYACKYIFKDIKDDIVSSMYNMSKKPPIGHEYFQQLAEKYVEQGIAPQDLKYSFPEIRRQNKKPVIFQMTRKTAENFCAHFVKKWQEKYGKSELSSRLDVAIKETPELNQEMIGMERPARRIPASPVIEAYLDKRVAQWSEQNEVWRTHYQHEEWAMRRMEDGERKTYVEEQTRKIKERLANEAKRPKGA